MTDTEDTSPDGFPLWSLREDVHVESDPAAGVVILHSRWGDEVVRRPGHGVVEALRRMSLGPVSLENAVSDTAERAALDRLLARLRHLVIRSLGLDQERPLISVVPLTPQAAFRPVAPVPSRPIRLSRFAVLRAEDGAYHLESPLSLHRVVLHRAEAVWLLGTLNRAVTPASAVAAMPCRAGPALSVLAYLMGAGMVVQARPGGPTRPVFDEDADPALATWPAQDLMFHTRSTLGRHDHDFGATYPMGERWTVEPVTKPATEAESVPLYRPRWEQVMAADPPLTAAVEGRRPTRRFGGGPVTAEEIGEVLYRAARVRSLLASPGDPGEVTSDRPYPSFAAAYELELYLAVGECLGLRSGVYHYDPLGHRLDRVPAGHAEVQELLERGRMSADLTTPPPVLVFVTARFRRMTWKYSGPGYALILKNTGALLQTLYLVGATLGLATCPMGTADIETTARVLGTDWRTESCVGGLALGRRSGSASGPPGRRRRPVNDPGWPDLAMDVLRRHHAG
ncbi:SagB/ThcOx family dehydrogenase [Sphaerisporangium aureirubrum]|uniref:SagB family peptide dehydrogenase n=1 Tax=Sphaerisporangium aureirubrum TaxID=1544736 RepID=A0ABW1NJL9_9ACTN